MEAPPFRPERSSAEDESEIGRGPTDPDATGPRSFRFPFPGGVLELGGGTTRVMGVINVTPDSFYDGGTLSSGAAAERRAADQIAAGAAVLDVGGESTRPGADEVGAEEEMNRVVPVVEGLVRGFDVPVSVDTYKAVVARAAVAAGAAMVNDVTGGTADGEMAASVAELGVPVIIGHIRGMPRNMQAAPSYGDPVGEILEELAARIEAFVQAGVAPEAILVDPGIGFGKRPADNLSVLAHLEELGALGHAVVVGASRKSFIARLAEEVGLDDEGPEDRLPGSIAAAVIAARAGAHLIRTHDVRATRQALAVADGTGAAARS